MKNLCLLLFLSLLLSCGKDDCINDVAGMYNGTCTSTSGNFQGVVKFYPNPVGEGELLIEDGVSLLSGFTGNLSGNCNKIIIASQPVVDINGLSVSISGTLHVNGNTISGDLNLDYGATQKVCTYNLIKHN